MVCFNRIEGPCVWLLHCIVIHSLRCSSQWQPYSDFEANYSKLGEQVSMAVGYKCWRKRKVTAGPNEKYGERKTYLNGSGGPGNQERVTFRFFNPFSTRENKERKTEKVLGRWQGVRKQKKARQKSKLTAEFVERRPQNPMDSMTRGSHPVRSTRKKKWEFFRVKNDVLTRCRCVQPRVYIYIYILALTNDHVRSLKIL